MADEKKGSKLTRMTLGGIEQIPSFTGNKEDYSFTKIVTFRGSEEYPNRGLIKFNSLGDKSASYRTKDYNPYDCDSFLGALNWILENEGWYLVYCKRDETFFKGYQRVEGSLYVPKERRDISKTG